MNANEKLVTAVFRNRSEADRAFETLHRLGYTESEINVLMSEKMRSTYYSGNDQENLGASSAGAEGTAIGGAVGTIVGATIAAVVAIGTSLVVPGLGLVIAGPLAAAFAGAGAGAVTGGIIGGLVGLGISESNAKAYEAALREGGIVLGVVPRNDNDLNVIKKEFQKLHGDNIVVTSR